MAFSTLFPRPSTDKSIPLLPIYVSHSPTPYQTAPISPNIPPPLPDMTDPVPLSDPLLSLSRQETHLQSTLQILLDAQSEGLLAGLGGPSSAHDDASSTGSRTPTTPESMIHSRKPKSVVPVRQPAKKKVGLHGARRGIARAISDLANLKSEEGRVLEDDVARRGGILSTVTDYERKTIGLREQIRGIQSEDTSRRVEHLKAEEKTLASSIHDLETQLYEMNARHRQLIREMDGLNNSVQSKLSSYESALALAEKDIKSFLSRPPVETSTKASTGIWALPKERRTLEMAKEHYSEEQQTLKARFQAVQAEGRALEKGKVVWEAVVQEVTNVEKSLREEMQRMQSPLVDTGKDGSTKGMNTILQTMRHARTSIESKLDLAETKGWRLLVCCIGAELEALNEGQAVLEGALEASMASGGRSHNKAGPSESSNGTVVVEGPLIDDSAPAASPLDIASPARGFLDRSEDEDDGPGPELLVSQHEF